MKVNFAFKNVKENKKIVPFIERKLKGVSKFLKSSDRLNWFISFKDKAFSLRLHMSIKGKSFVIKAKENNFFKAVNDVLGKAKGIAAREQARSRRRLHLS